MPKLDIDAAEVFTGTIYPEPYHSMMTGRFVRKLGDLGGLTHFGVNIVTLEPGALASLRHWHASEDEFAMVLEGDLVLIEDAGEVAMRPGDCAAWKAGEPNGHRFVNRSDRLARFLVVGTRSKDELVTYSDVDMKIRRGVAGIEVMYHDGSAWDGPRDAPKGERE